MSYSTIIAGLIREFGFTNTEEGGLDCYFQIAEHCTFSEGGYQIQVMHGHPSSNVYAGVTHGRCNLSNAVFHQGIGGYDHFFAKIFAPLMGTEHEGKAREWAARFIRQ